MDTGLFADPLFESPGAGGTIGDADHLGQLVAYRPRPTSPLLDAGLNLAAQFGIDPGGRDFAGFSLPQAAGYDIGAVERPTPPGDANRDGTVNFDDLLVLAKNYNGTARAWSQGDFTGDGVVNFDDLLVLAKNYNRSAQPTGAPSITAASADVSALVAAVGIAQPAPLPKAPSARPPTTPPKKVVAPPKAPPPKPFSVKKVAASKRPELPG
jgi:hypothetical protein